MQNPFVENGYLLPEASLNKLRLVSIGAHGIRGKSALDLVSGEFFNECLDAFFEGLNIKSYNDRHRRFIECLTDGDETVRARADEIARRVGENLGYILLALSRGDRENRPEWSDKHWEYWHNIECVYLSGGLSYGVLGERLRLAVEELFDCEGSRPYRLAIADNSEYLPLVGAYQRGAQEAQCMVLLDFGHTYVKRGYAADGGIVVSDKIDSIVRHMDGETEAEKTGLLNDFIIDVLVDTCSEMERMCSRRAEVAAVSIANYIDHGVIYPHRGEYGRLVQSAGNYESYLTRVLSSRLGRELRVILVHDGTAAAYGVNDSAAAVITLGTGLGVGFCDMRLWEYKNFSIKKEKYV